jgi:hypothetical protein
VDGPIRVPPVGGGAEIAGPTVTAAGPVLFAGIDGRAEQGVPAVAGQASANTGQVITLRGSGFDHTTLIEFAAMDDEGVAGGVRRTGSASADRRTLSVEVPALARTGLVRVVGAEGAIPLQIVPVLRSVGGTILAGNTIVLEGTGLVEGEAVVRIDGRIATMIDVRTISDHGVDQQFVNVEVPPGVGAGVITVSTAGGTFAVRPPAALGAQPDVNPVTDVGDSIATALTLGLPLNSEVSIRQTVGDGPFPDRDVDVYRLILAAGDRLTFDIDAVDLGLLNSWLRVFDDTGVELPDGANNDSGGSSDSFIGLSVPRSGTYYVGVSGFPNGFYDPNVAGSGGFSSAGAYRLHVRRIDGASTTIASIEATALDGTPAYAGLPSANTGQSIMLSGSGFVDGDRVVFTTADSAGTIWMTPVTPASVAADGRSIAVAVPHAAVTGQIPAGGADTDGCRPVGEPGLSRRLLSTGWQRVRRGRTLHSLRK